jgi:hypothetical protein
VFRLKATGEATSATLASHEGEGDTLVSPYTIVYARELVWDPKGDQEERLPRPAAVVNGDIVLAKLAPGQSIELEAHAVKGIGKDHAKFSPVATASYKLHTTISFPEGPFVGEDAEKLVAACPMKVFDIEDIGGEGKGGGKAAKGKGECGGGWARGQAAPEIVFWVASFSHPHPPFPLPPYSHPHPHTRTQAKKNGRTSRMRARAQCAGSACAPWDGIAECPWRG